MSGADPCTGSKMDGPVFSGFKLPLAATPESAGQCHAQVREDVADEVSVTITSNRTGSLTM